MNESVLIGTAEKFLGKISQKNINADAIADIESFMDLYIYLKSNLADLYEFRDTMEIKGYKAPYRSIVKYGRPLSSEMVVEDMHDITRHTRYFRMKAAAKKNILDRIKSSIASHKIAIGHLEEFGTVRCSSCRRKYQGHEIADVITKKCSCGSLNLKLEVNPQGVYRLAVIKYLPLSGDYMVKMSDLSTRGREAFRKIVHTLKQEKRGAVKTLSMVVKVFEDGRWVRKRVNLDGMDQINYEREIRKKYGPDARIEFLQFHRKRPSIINDKHVQTALSLAYVKFAEDKAKKIRSPLLVENLKNLEKIKIYDHALKTSRETALKVGGESEDLKSLKNELLSDKLSKEGLMDKKGLMDIELDRDISTRDRIEKYLLVDVPHTLILWDIIKYYLCTSYDRRNKYSGPFPYLRPHLDKNQRKSFEDFQLPVVNILKSYFNEKIEQITNISKILSGKFEMEKKMKGLHLKTNPAAVGAVILNSFGKLSLEESATVFSLSSDDVQSEKDKIETFQKPSTPKAQKFLEMIKE